MNNISNLNEQERKELSKNIQILWRAKDYWDALDKVRKEGIVNRQMLQNIQWTAEELKAIERENREPITHNIMVQMVNNLKGQYLSSKGNPVAVARKQDSAMEGKMMSLGLEHASEINDDTEKDLNNFVNLLTYAFAVSRTDFGYISERDKADAIIENVNFNLMFFTPILDDGNIDKIDMIGQICEDTIDGLIINFAHNKTEADKIKEVYNYQKDDRKLDRYYSHLDKVWGVTTEQNDSRFQNMDFFYSEQEERCRYYEIWTKERRFIVRYHDTLNGETGISEKTIEEIESINAQRIAQCISAGIDPQEAKLINAKERYEWIWRVRFLTPSGYCLLEKDSPFVHQSHPYTICSYQCVDGKVHSLLSDVVPLQRILNKLWMIIMFQIGHAAKGMLVYDKKLLQNSGVSEEDFRYAWSTFDQALGLNVPSDKKLSDLVYQFYSQTNITPMMSLFQQITQEIQTIMGVNSAIQGQTPNSYTPASRYAQESANSQLNSKPLLDCYNNYRKKKYNKVAKLLKQYYDEEDWVMVAGKENVQYKEDVSDLDYDITITQEITTSNYSITEDDKLFNMTLQGMIDPQMYFELSHAGYSKQALELIKQRQQEQQQAQMQAMMQQQAMQQQQVPQQETAEQMPEQTQEQPQITPEQEAEFMQLLQAQAPQQEVAQEQPQQAPQELPEIDENENRALLQRLLNK